ncbi:hypothetical protein BSIN_2505 [Burkholderia singularis]|uniref:Uncharacterized protein n=1 Tax=Burkholderia singularis TaxID=1503053 RepID=A0A238H2M2_9BURK|nr:hypothetical protein BSIN_2505 [Burkholderia singularis]
MYQRSSRRMPDRHTRDPSSPAEQSQPLERGRSRTTRARASTPARCPPMCGDRHAASRRAGGTDLAVAICGAHVGV